METNSNVEPRLQTGCAQPYVAIPIKVTLEEWSKANALISEMIEWLDDKEAKVAGPLFYRYYVMGDADKPFTIEVGFPVSVYIQGDERVLTGYIPNGTFATFIHCGHPDKLMHSFDLLNTWALTKRLKWKVRSNGKDETWDGRFEFYMTNPANESDMNKWRTAIAILIDE